MIFDKLENKESYKEMKDLYTVLCKMQECKEQIPSRIVIREGDVFINPVSLTTKPKEDCLFEAHKNFTDVHCVLTGREYISVQRLDALQEKIPYNPENDCGFYDGEALVTFKLCKGWFLACFPHDPHRVCENGGNTENVEKIVGKIRAANI